MSDTRFFTIFIIASIVAVFAIILLMPAKKCPGCGHPFPKFRKPSSSREALWGGCTCANCGTKVDREGKKLAS